MLITLEEAATRLGKSPRQVRYMIRQRTLVAKKLAGRWMIEEEALGLPAPQRAAEQRKADALRTTIERTLDEQGSSRRRPTTVSDLRAFRQLLPLHRAVAAALGEEHRAAATTFEALKRLALGCHRFHKEHKVNAYGGARDVLAEAVVALLVVGTRDADAWAAQLENDVLPSVVGLLSRYDNRRVHA